MTVPPVEYLRFKQNVQGGEVPPDNYVDLLYSTTAGTFVLRASDATEVAIGGQMTGAQIATALGYVPLSPEDTGLAEGDLLQLGPDGKLPDSTIPLVLEVDGVELSDQGELGQTAANQLIRNGPYLAISDGVNAGGELVMPPLEVFGSRNILATDYGASHTRIELGRMWIPARYVTAGSVLDGIADVTMTSNIGMTPGEFEGLQSNLGFVLASCVELSAQPDLNVADPLPPYIPQVVGVILPYATVGTTAGAFSVNSAGSSLSFSQNGDDLILTSSGASCQWITFKDIGDFQGLVDSNLPFAFADQIAVLIDNTYSMVVPTPDAGLWLYLVMTLPATVTPVDFAIAYRFKFAPRTA